MPIIFRAIRTNFNDRYDTRLTLDAIDNPLDQQALCQILKVPKTEVLYVQILRESEVPDDLRGVYVPAVPAAPGDGDGAS